MLSQAAVSPRVQNPKNTAEPQQIILLSLGIEVIAEAELVRPNLFRYKVLFVVENDGKQ